MKRMSKTLGIRLDEETEQMLDNLTESMSMNKSQLLKMAFHEWAHIKRAIQQENKILCDRILLSRLFSNLAEDQIPEIAEAMSEHIISIIKIRQIETNTEETLPQFLQNYTNFAGRDGAGWYHKINHTLNEDGNVTIYGLHSLNRNFSLYQSQLLSRILEKKFCYISQDARVTENSIILQYKPE
jgi:hypothetical protein